MKDGIQSTYEDSNTSCKISYSYLLKSFVQFLTLIHTAKLPSILEWCYYMYFV